ncbi:type IX secretion system anionic LPS delivery protein PorZ [Emticicia fluvialis]|uniref:type IX secretion system anionic LPS delivery protein PorZ n=1 Tax=Emticicia fluvialis TaxID=2974474 RepID=UPI00216501A8|nr:two-component regulator propeller domain-containing protein [Emticicia fluvialis]
MLRFLFCLWAFQTWAQIPTKSWRTHNNYVNLKGVEVVEKKVFAFSGNGFFYYDKLNRKATKLSKADGLAEANPTQIRYSPTLKKLLVAYENGNLDLIKMDADGVPAEIENVNFIKNTSTIQTAKRINAIEFKGDFAYLATDFGLVVLDAGKAEIKETYQNLGSGGKELGMEQILFARDSIFVLTSDGILGARYAADVNLQFYGNWRPVINKQLFVPKDYPAAPLLVNPVEMETDAEGKLWIADAENGLVSNWEGDFRRYSPNGITGQLTGVFYSGAKIFAPAATIGNVFENQTWTTLPLNQLPAYTEDITDAYGFRWYIVSNGVRVADNATQQTRLYTVGRNAGNLPSSRVNTLAIDRDGVVWIGTNDGVAAVITARDVFSRPVDAYTPFNSAGRRILLQETINKIVVDGGNRKWIGTNNGLNLFNPSVDELIQYFTEENSPLPANEITGLSIDTKTGEVFVLTAKGLLSYQTDATEPEENFSSVSIYPNPIRPDFQGVLTISGLKENSVVKITDAAGRLIYETKSNGGTASWNLTDSSISRTVSGVYMVFSIAADGSESYVGKLAVVR